MWCVERVRGTDVVCGESEGCRCGVCVEREGCRCGMCRESEVVVCVFRLCLVFCVYLLVTYLKICTLEFEPWPLLEALR